MSNSFHLLLLKVSESTCLADPIQSILNISRWTIRGETWILSVEHDDVSELDSIQLWTRAWNVWCVRWMLDLDFLANNQAVCVISSYFSSSFSSFSFRDYFLVAKFRFYWSLLSLFLSFFLVDKYSVVAALLVLRSKYRCDIYGLKVAKMVLSFFSGYSMVW